MARQKAAGTTDAAGRTPPSGLVLALACAAQFMVVLDVSVLNVALPAIQSSLGFGAMELPWIAGAYALAFAGFLLLGGRLADLYGAGRVFLAGLALFTLPSLAGGLATTPELLIAARAAQGLGAAVLAPATLTVLTVHFPEGPRRTRAFAGDQCHEEPADTVCVLRAQVICHTDVDESAYDAAVPVRDTAPQIDITVIGN